MRFRDTVLAVGVSGLLLLACSCGGSKPVAGMLVNKPQPSPGTGRPDLPSPAELLKTVSTTEDQRWFYGDGYDSSLPRNLESSDGSTGVVLTPSWNEENPTPASDIGYVVYRFGGFDTYSGGSSLFTSWDGVNLGQLWIGLANFQTGHWDWYNSPGDPEIDPPALTPYIAPDGSAFMAVLLLGTTPSTLHWVLLGDPLLPVPQLISNQPGDPLQCTAPLNVSFDASGTETKGSVIKHYEMDYEGDGIYDDNGNESIFTHNYTVPGVYHPTVRVTDSYDKTATASLDLHVINPANTAPNAAFTPANPTGNAPLNVNFDANSSSDGDGSIALYEWDFDGDGQFDYSSSSPLASHSFSRFGATSVKLRVTDNDLATSEATDQVTCTTGWRDNMVTSLAGVLDYQVGLAVQGSGAAARPCVSYVDVSQGDLYFVRGTDNTGQNWGIPVAVDTGGATHAAYGNSSLLMENLTQAPAIAYGMNGLAGNPTELRYSRATSSTGAVWNVPVVVNSGPGSDQGCALLQSGGKLLLAERYGNSVGSSAIRVYRSTDGLGTGWALVKEVQPPGSGLLVYPPALITVPGLNPLLAWAQNSAPDGLAYMCSSATSADGADWNAPLQIPRGAASTEEEVELGVSGGQPIFAAGGTSSANGGSKLWFNRASDAQGSTWPNPPGFLDEGWVGADASIANVNGFPAIAYSDTVNSALKYIIAADASGSGWNAPQTVDSAGHVGNCCSLAVLPGNIPLILYQDRDNKLIKAAVFF